MALIKCSECNKEISEKARTCPNCGAPVPQETRKVIIERKKEFVGSGLVPTVYIDDMLVGVMKVGTKFEVDVELGEHNLILDYEVDKGITAVGSINGIPYSTPLTTAVSNKKRIEKIKINEETKVLKINFEKGLKMKVTEVNDDYQVNETEEKIETVEIMEAAPTVEVVEVKEIDEEKELIKEEKAKLSKEKDELVEKNAKLAKEYEKLVLENEKLKEQKKKLDELEIENEELKENKKKIEKASLENDELSSKLADLEKEKAKLAKDLKDIHDKKVEKRIEKGKDALTKGYNGTKKLIRFILNTVRYLFGGFLLLGSIVCITSREFELFLFFFLSSITIMPLLYKLLWKFINVSDMKKIMIQIIVPVVIFIASLILFF